MSASSSERVGAVVEESEGMGSAGMGSVYHPPIRLAYWSTREGKADTLVHALHRGDLSN